MPAAVVGLDRGEYLVRGFPDQEQATAEQHQVAAADALTEYAEKLARQTHHPGQREQQCQARKHREGQAEPPGLVALLGRQPADQDRNEDDVVDAENDLERRQHREGDPDVRVEKQFPVGFEPEREARVPPAAQSSRPPVRPTIASSDWNTLYTLR